MSTPLNQLSSSAKVFIAFVIICGAAALTHSALWLRSHPAGLDWIVLAGLTLLTGSLTIKIPTVRARLSVSEVFVFAAVLWFGPAVATFIVALDTLVGTLWLQSRTRSPVRALFNVSAGVSAIWIAAHLFVLTAPPSATGRPQIGDLLQPVLLLAVSYFTINSLLIAAALGFEQRTSPLELWRRNFFWLGLNHLVGASVAVLLVAYTPSIDITALSLIVPLLVITYLTFRMSLGRLADAHHHVAQLNELYLSTVETLAMAVDAKDQITHGHIRRVQVYTLELAKRLGVRDGQQLKAIEAAALLHDMGKLAIPEHILNKPGKLTPAEFDNMKRHTDIGADLLSSIRFPYPVVPIVRHHHENWDGTGYPAGLSGMDIPIGARILSVVDCFDALTSDRPYRPRLASEEAFAILMERRGRMYDPVVVDTFIASHAEIAPLALTAGQQARSLIPAADTVAQNPTTPLSSIRATAAQSSLLAEYARDLQRACTFDEASHVAGEYARLLTPGIACAVYKYFPDLDILRCVTCAGDHSNLILGLSIRRGERVSGWAAANHRPISNSQADLDLREISRSFDPPLRSALAVPLITTSDRLVGVLTAYAPKDDAFSDAHRYAFERVASLYLERLNALTDTGSVLKFQCPDRK